MTATQQEHEEGLGRFIQQSHRRRFRESVQDEKLRRKLRQKLAHFPWLDERYLCEAPSSDPQELAQVLRERGASATCFLLSENGELDGRELPLEEALAVVLRDDFGSLVSCVAGRLALYSEEAPQQAPLLLQRAVSGRR